MSSSRTGSGVRLVPVSTDRDGQRVDNFLATQLKGVPRSAVYRMIRTGQVRINGSRCKPSTKLAAGDQVRIPPARTHEQGQVIVSERVREQLRASVLYEDEDLLVIDKPSGMAVHAGSGLPWGVIDVLRQERAGQYLELVHRLDRETSGCLLLARNGAALGELSQQFRTGKVRKHYLCLLDGKMPEPLLEVNAPLRKVQTSPESRVEVRADGKPALTRFRLLEAFGDSSYAEAELLTGRTHQIRVHAAFLGLPLAGDGKYAPKDAVERWKERGLKRLFLHAHRLELTLPGGAGAEFSAPLPEELRSLLTRLGA
ncbi:MAG: RluA family pseudouridine synthase [Xanthomonadales bacterium]|nr:RluA family pseudouridine synthase [Xanthomonadales bacterium]